MLHLMLFSSPAVICMKFDDLRRASLRHLDSWCIINVRRLAPTAFFQSFIPDEQSLFEWLPDIF